MLIKINNFYNTSDANIATNRTKNHICGSTLQDHCQSLFVNGKQLALNIKPTYSLWTPAHPHLSLSALIWSDLLQQSNVYYLDDKRLPNTKV